MRADQSVTPDEKQARIVGRVFEKGVQNFNDPRVVLQHGIAEAQKLANERVVGMHAELAFERRNSVRVEPGSESGESPRAVQARSDELPARGLRELFRSVR